MDYLNEFNEIDMAINSVKHLHGLDINFLAPESGWSGMCIRAYAKNEAEPERGETIFDQSFNLTYIEPVWDMLSALYRYVQNMNAHSLQRSIDFNQEGSFYTILISPINDDLLKLSIWEGDHDEIYSGHKHSLYLEKIMFLTAFQKGWQQVLSFDDFEWEHDPEQDNSDLIKFSERNLSSKNQ